MRYYWFHLYRNDQTYIHYNYYLSYLRFFHVYKNEFDTPWEKFPTVKEKLEPRIDPYAGQ